MSLQANMQAWIPDNKGVFSHHKFFPQREEYAFTEGLTVSKADFNFTNLDGDVITFPAATADWSSFSLVGLGGNETWPVPTTAMAASNQDLRTAGAFRRA